MALTEPDLAPASRRPKALIVIGTAARLLLAGVWLYAGGSKVSDLSSSVRAVNAYELLPNSAAQVVGSALPFVEILVGLLLLAGLFTRTAAALSAGLLIVFIIGIISAWARGLQIDCGCFGSGGALAAGESPTYFWETLRDMGFLLAAAYLIIRPSSWLAVDGLLTGQPREQA